MEKYGVREQGKDGAKIYDDFEQAQNAAKNWSKDTGVVTIIYRMELVQIWHRDGKTLSP